MPEQKPKRKRAKPSYGGSLNTRIIAKPVSPGWNRLTTLQPSEEQQTEYITKLFQQNPHLQFEIVGKMQDLLDHYRISPFAADKWFRLAVSLAKDHVSGFDIVPSTAANRRGRKSSWSEARLLHLVKAIDELRSERKGRTIPQACALLAKKPEWKGLTGKNLAARYHDGKKLR